MTARYANRVALMSADGRMAEMGNPRELMEDESSRLSTLINKVDDSCFCFPVWCTHVSWVLVTDTPLFDG